MNPNRLSPRELAKTRPALRLLAALERPLAPWLADGVFMFHQGRCGSTVLAHLLDRHPKLTDFGGIFEKPYQRGRLPAPAAAMLRAKRAQAFPGQAFVAAKFFECLHLALLGASIEEFAGLLRACGYRRFIVLDRKNYLKTIVSSMLALRRGRRFHYRAGEAIPDVQVAIDVDRIKSRRRAGIAHRDVRLHGYPVRQVARGARGRGRARAEL